ncbi:hypothetical protein ECP03047993_5388 [Escherichia coli P0304799.3]|nr:hypothetical protein ECP03047993_5388 [Escherichia coli P0304799.3]
MRPRYETLHTKDYKKKFMKKVLTYYCICAVTAVNLTKSH